MFKKMNLISKLVPMAAIAVFGLSTTGLSHAQQVTRITYVSPSPSAINSYPIFVAIGEGYFKDEGIEVKAEAVNGSGPVLQVLSSGQAQLGRPGPAPLIKARARGVDVVFVYNSLPRTSFGILVKTDSKYKLPVDLKGKTIGVGTADGAEVGAEVGAELFGQRCVCGDVGGGIGDGAVAQVYTREVAEDAG
jgi:NitT/TauT family transport system substrate-binding protein